MEPKQTNPPVIIVLGGSNDPEGNLSIMSMDRCTKTLEVHQRNPTLKILLTGGFGDHFNQTDQAHGAWVRQELVRRGIPNAQFLEIAKSGYTEDDARQAKKVLGDQVPGELILITSDFHMERALYYFLRYFPETKIEPLPATSTLPADELATRIAHERSRLNALKRSETNTSE